MKPNNFPVRTNLNGSEELYTQTSGVSQKFTLEQAKGFITTPIDITYSELYSKVTNGELVAGSWYRLTDYKSVNFLNGWEIANNNPTPTDPNFNPQQIYTGETEVLILQATSSYEISEIGYSETFNGDIIQYEPFTNKIGVSLNVANGYTLPDSSTVSDFDLKWDGTNVYFNMPDGYPALFGHYFYLYCSFDGGSYYQDGNFEPLTPNISICQYPYTSDDVDLGYSKAMSRIRIENGGMKVVLLDLDETDFNNYDADTLYVNAVYEIGDAYGWITRRIDTYRNIDVPFDFRGRKYRRFEVDLTAVNPDLGTGYYGQGDNYLGQGTTGNYKDFKSFGEDGYDAFNIKWDDMGGADAYWYRGYNDNNVFLGYFSDNTIGAYFRNNTIGNDFFSNTIGNNFNNNTIGNSFYQNTIGNSFFSNTIGNYFYNNTIGNRFNYNTIGNNFYQNTIGNDFFSNTIGNDFFYNTIGNYFYQNTIGNSFQYNTIGNYFYNNTIGNNFNNNTIGNDFFYNTIGYGFGSNTIGNSFFSNTIGNDFIYNTIGNDFYQNTIVDNFQRNQIEYSPTSTNFTLATHVYGDYTCTIFKNSAGSLRLSYIDGTDTIQYTAVNA